MSGYYWCRLFPSHPLRAQEVPDSQSGCRGAVPAPPAPGEGDTRTSGCTCDGLTPGLCPHPAAESDPPLAGGSLTQMRFKNSN